MSETSFGIARATGMAQRPGLLSLPGLSVQLTEVKVDWTDNMVGAFQESMTESCKTQKVQAWNFYNVTSIALCW